MRRGESIVGIERLKKLIEDTNRSFGDNDCLYLNQGTKKDPRQKVDRPYAVVRCKYTGCSYSFNLKVDLNEQNELVFRYLSFKQTQHLEHAHGPNAIVKEHYKIKIRHYQREAKANINTICHPASM